MSVRDLILSARTLRTAAIFQIIESASTLHPVRSACTLRPAAALQIFKNTGALHPVRALLRVQAAVFARGHAERRRKLPVKGGRVGIAQFGGDLFDRKLGLRQQLCRLPPQTAARG